MANQIITRVQVEGNDVVSFLNGTNYVRSMSQILQQSPTYISYKYDTITISQVGGDSFTFTIYTVTEVGGNTFLALNFQSESDIVQARTIEIYRLLVTSIFKGCCECGNTEPECSIQYTAGTDPTIAGTLWDVGGVGMRINYFTANSQDFTGFWPIIQDGSWIFVFSKTDPTVYGVYQLSNYTDGGTFAQFDSTLLAGPAGFPDGTSLCVDVTSVGGSLVQDWQDTLNISSLLTQNNIVDGGGFNFDWTNVNRYTIESSNYQAYIADDGAGSLGRLEINPGSVTINGNSYIDIITPNYGAASAGWVLAYDGSGHVEYTPAGTGTVVSVGLVMPSAFTVSNSPITISGDIDVVGAGTDLEYINGLGELATLPVYTVENGLHAFGGVPGEAPPDPFLFHLGGQLREDTTITVTNGASEYFLGVEGLAGQDAQQPFGVSNNGNGGVASFQDYGAGFRPNPSVEVVGDIDLFQPLLELTMEGNLPAGGILADRTSLLRLKYDGDPSLARMSIDYQFKNDDVPPNNVYFIGGRLTTEVTNFTANAEESNFELQLFSTGSRGNKLVMEGKGQLELTNYATSLFWNGDTNINNDLEYVLAVDNTGKVWKKVSEGGGTVTSVTATGLLTTSPDPIETTGVVTSEMDSGFLVGRYSAGTGVFEQITIGDGLALDSLTGTLTADGSVPVYTVNNGLSPDPLDANNFQLGGPLVQDTTITGGAVPFTNYLHIDNLNGFSLDVNNKGYLISENGDDKSQFIFTKLYASSRYENNITGELAEVLVGGDSGTSNVEAFLRAGTVFGETGIYAGVVPGILPYTANMLGVKTPKVANGSALVGQVLTLKSMTGPEAGRVEFEDAGGGGTYDSDQGIYKDTSLTNDTFMLGAPSGLQGTIPFTVNRYINTKASSLNFEGNPDGGNIINIVANTGTNTSRGISVDYTNSNKSTAFYGTVATGGVGLEIGNSGTGFDIKQIGASKLTTNSPVPGIALAMEFLNPSNTASGDGVKINLLNNTIESYYTNGTFESNLRFSVRPDGSSASINSLELDGTEGQVIFNQYGQTPAKFPDATPVWALGVDGNGNVVEFDPGGGSPSPLTTKGDLYTFDTADTRLPVGLNTQVLLADSSTPTGLRWGTNTTPPASGYYGAFLDDTIQTAVSANTAYPVKFNTTDLSNGVTVVNDGSGNPTRVTLANTGIYNVQFSLQLEKTGGGGGNFTVDVWLRKNGLDIPDTTGKVVLTGSVSASPIVAAWNYLLDLAGGDYVQLMWSTSNVNVELFAEGPVAPHPGVPSSILTVTQQAGILAGTGITAINSLTGAVQTMGVGTGGTDFAIDSTGAAHTFNLPTASAANRGALSNTDWTRFDSFKTQTIGVTVDGSGGVVTAGQKGYVRIPYACTITSWSILTGNAGTGATVTFDILRANNAIPSVSLVGGGTKPFLTSNTAQIASAAPAGWTSVTLAANDILGFNVESGAAVFSWVNLQLTINRT
jgi:hypothetical protein